ncbi:hypothetical protein GCM10007388_44220 [Pseudoduganella plicata]|uniref:Uncharacterized protein n=1 Tax=Pseudoduganella plicata TaxID=321984 RepID=A0AA87YAG2_9BURK|nr:hypothetical protein GCM10007388_44220 [Pseudoduganella plicata]
MSPGQRGGDIALACLLQTGWLPSARGSGWRQRQGAKRETGAQYAAASGT